MLTISSTNDVLRLERSASRRDLRPPARLQRGAPASQLLDRSVIQRSPCRHLYHVRQEVTHDPLTPAHAPRHAAPWLLPQNPDRLPLRCPAVRPTLWPIPRA